MPVDAEPSFLLDSQVPGLSMGIELIVSDQVVGGCWTSASSTKQKVRLLFEQSNIHVYEDDIINTPFFPLVVISANGFKVGEVCFANIGIEVIYHLLQDWEAAHSEAVYIIVGQVRSWVRSAIISSPTNLNQQILEFVEASASEFAADVISARRDETVKGMVLDWGSAEPINVKEAQ